MSQQVIAIGAANGGQGDAPFVYCAKVNANFAELYMRVGVLESGSAVYQPASARLTALTNGTIDGIAIGSATRATGAFSTVTTTSLTLGASTLTGVGTAAGTVAAGNDSRITGAVQVSAFSSALDSAFTSARGSILYRGASGWVALAPGTSGYVLQTGGASADPVWVAQATSGSGVSSSALDTAFGSAQGSILYRGASAWTTLTPGTAGQVLTTNGNSANPTWTAPSSYTPTTGAVVSSARVQSSALASTSTQTPFIDTAPTTSNSAAITALTVSITPKAATNKLRVRAVVQVSLHGLGSVVASLFQNGGTTAVASNYATIPAADYSGVIEVTFEIVAGSTSAQTFNIGVAGNNGFTTTVNGINQARLMGGTTYSSIEVTEVLP